MDAFYASVAVREPPRPGRRARDRRRRRARGGAVGQLPRPRLRRPVRHARHPRPPAVPAGGGGLARLRRVQHRVPGGDGDLPAGHPAGRGGLPRRGVPRRPRLDPAARAPAARSPSSCAPWSTTSRGSPARSASPRRSRWPSWPAAAPSPTGWSSSRPRQITSFLHPLGVGELWGVGEKTRDLLHRLGLVTVGDVAHTPLRTLQRAVGDALGSHLHAAGLGHRPARDRPAQLRVRGDPDKSMGANETFGRDTDDREVISRELLRLTAKVTRRMRVGRGGRPHRDDHGPVRRLHHHHPVHDPPRGHRRHPRGAPHRPAPLRRPRAAAGPDPAGRGTGRGAGRHARPCTVSWCWASASTAGRDADRAVDRARSGSGPTRSVRPAFSPDPLWLRVGFGRTQFRHPATEHTGPCLD